MQPEFFNGSMIHKKFDNPEGLFAQTCSGQQKQANINGMTTLSVVKQRKFDNI